MEAVLIIEPSSLTATPSKVHRGAEVNPTVGFLEQTAKFSHDMMYCPFLCLQKTILSLMKCEPGQRIDGMLH